MINLIAIKLFRLIFFKLVHAGIGFRKAPLDLFGNPDTSLMGRDEKRRYQLWEEIRR